MVDENQSICRFVFRQNSVHLVQFWREGEHVLDKGSPLTLCSDVEAFSTCRAARPWPLDSRKAVFNGSLGGVRSLPAAVSATGERHYCREILPHRNVCDIRERTLWWMQLSRATLTHKQFFLSYYFDDKNDQLFIRSNEGEQTWLETYLLRIL